MKPNVGGIDRIARIALGLVLGAVVLFGYAEGALAIVLGIAAVASIATGLFRFCGLYTILGISTCPLEEKR
jgi:hypothetical protein